MVACQLISYKPFNDIKSNAIACSFPGMMTSPGNRNIAAQYEGQGYPTTVPRDQQGMLAVVPHHVLQSNPQVLKGQGQTSPKMAAIEVLDLTKRENELRMQMQQGSGSGGDAPLDLSVKRPEKTVSEYGNEHQNPNWGQHMIRTQEGSRYSPHITRLEDSLHKHLKGVDIPVYPSDLLNRPPLGMPHPHHPHPPGGAAMLRPGMAPGGITTGQPLQHSNATPEQVATLGMHLGMTPEAIHAAQQQQQQQMAAVAAASTAQQHRYEAQHHNVARLQRYSY